MDCRNCGEFIRGEEDRIGARCPRCRQPIYEKKQTPRRAAVGTNDPVCAFHPTNQAAGPCQRCGTLVCGVCRARWHEQILCLACVQASLEKNEAGPVEVRSLRRQSLLSFFLALGGWALLLVGSILLWSVQGGKPHPDLALLGRLTLFVSFVPAAFALGQAASAIRMRGQRLRLATSGMILAGVHLGLMIGFGLLSVWHN
ncbi:MAG TPA: hypothetical protein VKE98_02885 [Gemmataceae bacterium]|nr:hypothetical protein [Gemmataceae bacterium]